MPSVIEAGAVIAIVGATGAQGGGLARAVVDDPAARFRARVLTRKPSSDAARALARRGAEVVAANLDEPDSIRRAFSGASAAFCVTNYWEHFSPDREIVQARAMAAAAKETGLRHVIWSTLEDTRHWVPLSDDRLPTLHGKYKVPHFDCKGESNRWFTEAGVPTTFLLTSFYWDNLIHCRMGPRRGAGGVLTIWLFCGFGPAVAVAVADDPDGFRRLLADRPQAVRHLRVECDRVAWAKLEFLEADLDAEPTAHHVGVFLAAVPNERILVARRGADFVHHVEKFHFRIGLGRQPFPPHAFGKPDGVAISSALYRIPRVAGRLGAVGARSAGIAE